MKYYTQNAVVHKNSTKYLQYKMAIINFATVAILIAWFNVFIVMLTATAVNWTRICTREYLLININK